MNNDLEFMYGNDDDDQDAINENEKIRTQTKGILTEVMIHGEMIKMINPVEFVKLIETIKILQKQLSRTEYQVRLLEGQLRQKGIQISKITQELKNKIEYE